MIIKYWWQPEVTLSLLVDAPMVIISNFHVPWQGDSFRLFTGYNYNTIVLPLAKDTVQDRK